MSFSKYSNNWNTRLLKTGNIRKKDKFVRDFQCGLDNFMQWLFYLENSGHHSKTGPVYRIVKNGTRTKQAGQPF
jgi:hypothetical protein